MNKASFVYTTYIATTPEKLWQALTSGEFSKQYFFGKEFISDSNWEVGSSYKLIGNGKIDHYGEVLVSDPYNLLTLSWSVQDPEGDRMSTVSYELTTRGNTVKLTLKHEDLLEKDIRKDEGKINSFNTGWPAILSNLKSLLETGSALQI